LRPVAAFLDGSDTNVRRADWYRQVAFEALPWLSGGVHTRLAPHGARIAVVGTHQEPRLPPWLSSSAVVSAMRSSAHARRFSFGHPLKNPTCLVQWSCAAAHIGIVPPRSAHFIPTPGFFAS